MENVKKVQVTDEHIRGFLSKVFKTDEARLEFLGQVILQFGLDINTICEILNIPLEKQKEFSIRLRSVNKTNEEYLYNTLYRNIRNPQQVKQEFYDYMTTFYLAVAHKDYEQIKNCKSIFYQIERGIQNIIKNKKPNVPLSDDDIVTLLKFQIKYNLSSKSMCEKLNVINRYRYLLRVKALENEYPDLVNDFYTLTDSIKDGIIKRGER